VLNKIGRFLPQQREEGEVDAAGEDGVVVPFAVEFVVYGEHAAPTDDYPVDDQLG